MYNFFFALAHLYKLSELIGSDFQHVQVIEMAIQSVQHEYWPQGSDKTRHALFSQLSNSAKSCFLSRILVEVVA